MIISSGTRLGPYEIVESIGVGGMGEVWRAKDTRLGREVAIKALPAGYAANEQFILRFAREAKTISSLNHPHICTLHDVGEESGTHYLVMELIRGESLADRLKRGPLPLNDVLRYGRQIASALDVAHRSVVVHRDLKPGNIMLTKSGAKLLDFGLAKTTTEGLSPVIDISGVETEAKPITKEGSIVGTFQYMAPEQLEGLDADARTDIFALGAVLYEMATGERAFKGTSKTSLIAAIVTAEPEPISRHTPMTPPLLDRVVRRCLAKDPDERWQSAHDVAAQLEWISEPEAEKPLVRSPRHRILAIAAAFVAGSALAAAAVWLATRDAKAPPAPPVRFALHDLGLRMDSFQGMAVSPDGRRLLIRSRIDRGLRTHLQIRELDSLTPQNIPGSEDATLPFFSPDGGRIGFFTGEALTTIALGSGAKRVVAETDVVGGFAGGTWLPDDTIVFTSGREFRRVSAAGGKVETLEIDGAPSVQAVFAPWALPDGKALLCNVIDGTSFDIAVYDVAGRSLTVIARNALAPVYVETGHVIYQQGSDGPLMALPFDAKRRAVTGPAFSLVSDVGGRISRQSRTFAVGGGTLAYVPRTAILDRGSLVWVDRNGEATPIVDLPRAIDFPRLSPDGARIAFRSPAPACDIWIHDIERGTTTRVTREDDNHGPVWMPGGKRIGVVRGSNRQTGLWSIPADGAGEPLRISTAELPGGFAASSSPDGSLFLINSVREGSGNDVFLVDTRGNSVRRLLSTRYNERSPVFSPDGRHIAYVSDESGRLEVYVQPFPALDARQQISADGGTEPVWSRDGRSLYFRAERKMMAVDVRTEPGFSATRPRVLFEGDYAAGGPGLAAYDVSTDGSRFLMVREYAEKRGAEVHLVVGWQRELAKLSSGP